MTTYQSVSNGYTAFKVQSGLGTASSGASAEILRQTGGPGLRLTKASIESNEIRADLMRSRGRHGVQKVTGAWNGQVSLGSHDTIIEAVMRGTRSSANLALTQSDFTSLTTGTHTIVLTSGNPISLGLCVGDVIRLTGLNTTANNSRNLRITGLSSTTITVAELLTVDAVADTSCTITRTGKKLINPAAGALVKRYFTVEDYDTDLDVSESAQDFVFGSMKFSMAPNGLLMVDVNGIGTGQFSVNDTSTAPIFNAPTDTATVPMAVVDATIRIGSTDLVDLTSFDLTIDTAPTAPDVIGPTNYAPDVFPGQFSVAMNLTALRKDLAYMSGFLAETSYSLHVLAVELESEPKDFLSIYVPNFTLGGVEKAALNAKGGARTQTISIPAGLVGQDITGSGYDATMIKFQSSAA